MVKLFKIGNFNVSFSGEGPYYKALINYFSDKETSEKREVLLSLRIAEEGENLQSFLPDFYSLSGKISFNHDTYYINKGSFSYSVSNLFNEEKVTEVVILPNYGKRRRNIKSVVRLVSNKLRGCYVGSQSPYESFVRDITNYSCLWYLFAISLMKKDCIFLHCGMMSKDRLGIILTGTSGCGKTSTMLDMITNSGYKYMAEDFGILHRSGTMYDMQKKAAIYQSDVKWGNSLLYRAICSLCLSERMEWKLKVKLGINARHNFKPVEIFGDDIENEARVEKVFVLQRSMKNNSISCRNIASDMVAERAKTASFREIKELYEILTNIRAVGGDEYYSTYPAVGELEQQYLKIIGPALKEAKCFELSVPSNVNPSDASKVILSN